MFIQDSTLIGLPKILAHIWRGIGNQHTTANATACLKLSVRLNLTTGALDGPHTDHGLTSDRTIPLQDEPIPAGALRIADLGFFDLDVLQAIGQVDGYWLTRPQITTVLTDLDDQRLDLPTFLSAQATATVDVPIRLGARAAALPAAGRARAPRGGRPAAAAVAGGGQTARAHATTPQSAPGNAAGWSLAQRRGCLSPKRTFVR